MPEKPECGFVKSPAFQIYPAEFLADANTLVMSTAEIGAYCLLLFVCWRENGLPDDLDALAVYARQTPAKFKLIWDKRIAKCFQKREDGKWTHKRLEKERVKQQTNREKRAKAGRIGAQARWQTDSNRITENSHVENSAMRSDGFADCSLQIATSVVPFPDGNGVKQAQNFSLWTLAVGKLMATGTEESHARSLLAKLTKEHGKPMMVEAVTEMLASDPIEPKSYLIDLLKRKKTGVGVKLTTDQLKQKENEIRERMGYDKSA